MLRLFVTHTAHFVRGPDGSVYAEDPLLGQAFWTRYLSVFDQVRVAARVRTVAAVPEALPRSDGPGVEFLDLPDYRGPWQYAARRGELSGRLRDGLFDGQAVCLRVPCAIATVAWKMLRKEGTPYGLEVVGDPRDSLAAGGVKSVLRPLARALAVRDLRQQCAGACAVAYVTRQTLQRIYPASAGASTTHYSSIELPPEAVVEQVRNDFVGASRLVFVGSLAVRYKGPDILLRALAQCRRVAPTLTLIGDGRERAGLEGLARELGLTDRVLFRGQVPAGAAVRRELDAADLFVLPSRADALPRAMIEAMARGLPCIGTRVGGIPELLDDADLVTPGSARALAVSLETMLGDPARMARAANRNWRRAREFTAAILSARRREFYQQVLSRTLDASRVRM